MNNEQTLREEFYKEFTHYKEDDRTLKDIFDFFTTHHRQALEKVVSEVEGLKWPMPDIKLPGTRGTVAARNFGLDDALAIIRKEI